MRNRSGDVCSRSSRGTLSLSLSLFLVLPLHISRSPSLCLSLTFSLSLSSSLYFDLSISLSLSFSLFLSPLSLSLSLSLALFLSLFLPLSLSFSPLSLSLSLPHTEVRRSLHLHLFIWDHRGISLSDIDGVVPRPLRVKLSIVKPVQREGVPKPALTQKCSNKEECPTPRWCAGEGACQCDTPRGWAVGMAVLNGVTGVPRS